MAKKRTRELKPQVRLTVTKSKSDLEWWQLEQHRRQQTELDSTFAISCSDITASASDPSPQLLHRTFTISRDSPCARDPEKKVPAPVSKGPAAAPPLNACPTCGCTCKNDALAKDAKAADTGSQVVGKSKGLLRKRRQATQPEAPGGLHQHQQQQQEDQLERRPRASSRQALPPHPAPKSPSLSRLKSRLTDWYL